MSDLTKEQIETWRKICLAHWAADECGHWLTHEENSRQANALCGLALKGLELTASQEDAGRYRWLRLAGVDPVISERFVNICESEPETPELFDAAIDAARQSDK